MREESRTAEQVEIEAAVVRALERRPAVALPQDFAARVARSMPERLPLTAPSRPARRPIFGQVAGYLAVVAMTIVLMVLARVHPEALEAGRGFVFAMEVVLLAQLLAVGYWLGMRSDGLG